MDIEELKALVTEQAKQIDTFKTAAEASNDEVDRMRSHQRDLLEETKNAKTARTEATSALTAMQTKLDELEKKGLVHEGNYDELLAKQTEKMKLDFDTKLNETSTALQDITEKYTSLDKRYTDEKIHGILRKTAEQAKVIPSAIDDVIFRASNMFAFGDDGSVEARDKDGNLRKIGKKQLTPETFVESLKESATHLFPASEGLGASGKGKGHKGAVNPWAKDTFNRTEQAKMLNTEPAVAEQMMEEAKAS